ncbi:TetR/AcrR family transcriptional regulator [Botryobacter ruber]|uniref:TetR/AcrR family transcriptional regulator n=1 Tax=Botryobacter ruber TaxID=2171629 RepID=UPI001F0BBCA4|nr:TetR/AcrR family transcriptional regulator [Botryobacter ruber]
MQNRIVKGAFELFCQKGIKSVSMDEVAQHLSMSKKTIYKWFSNKDEMVFAAFRVFLENHTSSCECFIQHAENAIDEQFKIMEVTREIFANIHPVIFHDLQKYHAGSWQMWQKHKADFILGKIKENLERGMKEGLFRTDLDIEVVSRLRLTMIEVPFDRHIFPPHKFELHHVQESNLEIYMLGIATLKGHKLINKYKQITEEE